MEWPHQTYAISEVCGAIVRGVRRILLCIPTGGGKTYCASELARLYLEEARKVVLYTNRRMLVSQTSRVMAAAGHTHGVRAAGYKDEREHDFQISSIQTEASRVLRGKQWELHEAGLVLVDEAHIQKGDDARAIFKKHEDDGAIRVGFTATPIDLGDLYDTLIVAGNAEQLRACGALVAAIHYGPDEPDLEGIKGIEVGQDLTEGQVYKAIMREGIVGRVLESYFKLNPKQRPGILFAPGVKESAWFAEQFAYPEKREKQFQHYPAVRAAHIDGQDVWVDGVWEKTTQGARDRLLEESRNGLLPMICNRFVLREGIDAPWIEHLILATVLGSLQTYLQTVGRGLRASAGSGKEVLIIQDHGGNWHRHGSANANRVWPLFLTSAMAVGLRHERMRTGKEAEPRTCHACGRVIMGRKCPCGYENPVVKTRAVIQSDGTLRRVEGPIYTPRTVYTRGDGKAKWERMYFRAISAKWNATFRQAEALFAHENFGRFPDKSWPYMPVEVVDFYRKAAEVPPERLVPKPEGPLWNG